MLPPEVFPVVDEDQLLEQLLRMNGAFEILSYTVHADTCITVVLVDSEGVAKQLLCSYSLTRVWTVSPLL